MTRGAQADTPPLCEACSSMLELQLQELAQAAALDDATRSCCADCGITAVRAPLQIVAANLGAGPFLAVLCGPCWNRRRYRAQLLRSRRLP